jgi:xanthine dehydrogenase/oxidase
MIICYCRLFTETRFKHAVYPRLIFPSETVESLYVFTATANQLVIGACLPLSQIQHKCKSLSSDSSLTKTVMPIHDMLRWFASTQIRNVACLGGNLVTASPISDMNPMLASMGARLILSKLGDDNVSLLRRSVPVSEFFLKYRTVDIDPAEIVERVEVPVLAKVFEYVKPFKQARRREDDISIVTSGMYIRLAVKGEAFVIEQIDMAFGGMAPKTIMASETMKSMTGAEFNQATFMKAAGILVKEMKLPETVPGGQAAYRMTLAASFLYKFFLSVVEELNKDIEAIQADPASYPSVASPLPSAPTVDEKEASGTFNFLSAEKPSYAGVQMHPAPKVATGLEEEYLPKMENSQAAAAAGAVGKSSPHMSGSLHCTGEALYTDDIPQPPGTLQASLILSNECGAVLEALDVEPARGVPGVVGVYTAEDIKLLGGKNILGAIAKDEVIFLPVGQTVRTVGQVLGVVVAESLASAEAGARKAVPTYGKCEEKIIVTVADAIQANSFYETTRHVIERGDPSIMEKVSYDSGGVKKVGDIVKVSGSFSSGAQEHFYLETNTTLAIPSESDTNLTIYCSTQAVTKTQNFCSSSTGTPASKVVVRVKRMGGAFGGKETRSVHASCAAAIAAKRSSRPVRLTLPRDVDMSTTGTRHVFVSNYTASAEITQDGAKLVALDIKLYNNGGCGMDLSGPIADRALFHVDNCYNFPNIRAEAVACKTVQAPHTAFRGFGGPQGMAACEHVMEHLAVACSVPMEQFRRSNMYKNGETTHFGAVMGSQTLGKWNVPTIWDRLYRELDVPSRRAEVKKFNASNKWLKRGIALLPTKFGIAFTAKYMNQGKNQSAKYFTRNPSFWMAKVSFCLHQL